MLTRVATIPPTRVLVIEDDPVVRTLMAAALADAGYQVDEAGDSGAAVRLIDGDGYKLMITDMNVPGDLDGLQLAHHANQEDPDLPVVFVTGRHEVLNRLRRASIPGAALAKPFDLETLVEVVGRLIEERLSAA